MSQPYVHFADLAQEVEVPQNGILSRTLHSDDHVKVVAFAFDTGQELSEHTASMPAILQFVSGEADLIVSQDRTTAQPGTWVYMEPNTNHSIKAKSPLVMLLVLVKR